MSTALRAARPVYEHPWFVRFVHWTNAVALAVLVASGLAIFSAFPSFGAKVPERDLIENIPRALTLGGWLGGALQWHFTFMWLFAGGGMVYDIAQLASGHYRTVLFSRGDRLAQWNLGLVDRNCVVFHSVIGGIGNGAPRGDD